MAIPGIFIAGFVVLSLVSAGCRPGPVDKRIPKPIESTWDASRLAEPGLTAQTFIVAATTANERTLSHCFAEQCDPGFQPLRMRTASEEQLKALSAYYSNASVGEIEWDGDRASVEIQLWEGGENMELIETPEGWKIIGFRE